MSTTSTPPPHLKPRTISTTPNNCLLILPAPQSQSATIETPTLWPHKHRRKWLQIDSAKSGAAAKDFLPSAGFFSLMPSLQNFRIPVPLYHTFSPIPSQKTVPILRSTKPGRASFLMSSPGIKRQGKNPSSWRHGKKLLPLSPHPRQSLSLRSTPPRVETTN